MAGNLLNRPSFNLISDTGTTINITLSSVDTEFSQLLPKNTRKFTMQARDNNDFRWALTTGKVATPTEPYNTLKGGQAYFDDVLRINETIFLATDTTSQVIEIQAWNLA